MKYYLFSCLLACIILAGCQSENAKSASDAPTSPATSATNPSKSFTAETDCYFAQNIQVQVTVKDDTMEGTFQVRSAHEDISGTLLGRDYGEDFIADLEYKVGEKTHREKVIISVVANTMNFARSGMVDVDGERMKRNGGESTLDELLRKPCK